MSQNPYIVREMTQEDLSTCLAYTQEVKWPHQFIDWQFHYDLGKGSVIEDKQGNVIGTILWWGYGTDYATVGLVVVPSHMQGKGLGRALMDAIMEQAGSRNLQLVATLAGKRLYEQCGFTECGKIYQIQGLPKIKQAAPLLEGVTYRQLEASLLPDIIELDNDAYQAQRDDLIQALLNNGNGIGLYKEEKLLGYGFVRDSGKGQTIGPIIANDEISAKSIATSLLEKTSGFVRFDLTQQSSELKLWLLSLGLEQVDEVCLMTKGSYLPKNASSSFNFALASQALG